MNTKDRATLDMIKSVTGLASGGEWKQGKHDASSFGQFLKFMIGMFKKHPDNFTIWMVLKDDTEGSPAVCVTGNGEESEFNSAFFTMAKKYILWLIEKLEAHEQLLEKQDEELERIDGDVQNYQHTIDQFYQMLGIVSTSDLERLKEDTDGWALSTSSNIENRYGWRGLPLENWYEYPWEALEARVTVIKKAAGV